MFVTKQRIGYLGYFFLRHLYNWTIVCCEEFSLAALNQPLASFNPNGVNCPSKSQQNLKTNKHYNTEIYIVAFRQNGNVEAENLINIVRK